MEANEIICPQCGLANNELAESCVQCGIIFIKNPVMSTHAIQDDRKIKAIEEAETLLNDTPAPPEIGAFTPRPGTSGDRSPRRGRPRAQPGERDARALWRRRHA